MLKNIQSLGSTLSKVEQKSIVGGKRQIEPTEHLFCVCSNGMEGTASSCSECHSVCNGTYVCVG